MVSGNGFPFRCESNTMPVIVLTVSLELAWSRYTRSFRVIVPLVLIGSVDIVKKRNRSGFITIRERNRIGCRFRLTTVTYIVSFDRSFGNGHKNKSLDTVGVTTGCKGVGIQSGVSNQMTKGSLPIWDDFCR
jgi:hypothetical protein